MTLPADSLLRAEHIARARQVTLSTVIAEALANGLQTHTAAERSEAVMAAYKRAFTGFSNAEMAILDGYCSSPPPNVVDGSSCFRSLPLRYQRRKLAGAVS